MEESKGMVGRIKSITSGKSIIGVTILIRSELYAPLDSRKLVEIRQVDEPSK